MKFFTIVVCIVLVCENGQSQMMNNSLFDSVLSRLPTNRANAVTFVLQNHCPMTIWVGVQGNIANGRPLPDPSNGGLVLGSQQSHSMTMTNWGGRFWARFGCNQNGQNCLTGDCGELHCNGKGGEPDVTLMEITTKGTPDASGRPADHDYYDVSHVDAFNLPATIKPVNGRNVGNGEYDQCQQASCLQNLNEGCPDKMKEFKNGQQVACLSACTWANRAGLQGDEADKYCCRGRWNDPRTCPGSMDNAHFKKKCPYAYSYAYDDHSSTFHCVANKYMVTWC